MTVYMTGWRSLAALYLIAIVSPLRVAKGPFKSISNIFI